SENLWALGPSADDEMTAQPMTTPTPKSSLRTHPSRRADQGFLLKNIGWCGQLYEEQPLQIADRVKNRRRFMRQLLIEV
ncbi:MAG: hypothetical protein ABI680_20880, partial [Chthoniobacteraceae bacterium]